MAFKRINKSVFERWGNYSSRFNSFKTYLMQNKSNIEEKRPYKYVYLSAALDNALISANICVQVKAAFARSEHARCAHASFPLPGTRLPSSTARAPLSRAELSSTSHPFPAEDRVCYSGYTEGASAILSVQDTSPQFVYLLVLPKRRKGF